ncbi:MAG: Mandelate racemase/muconate lactonizing protein [Verrucomicrobia bacterium]|nr:Mandelate racemase/muconate lactonizing protein [Verrucomicrobiota bacterium]
MKIVEMQVTPIALGDPPLLNAAGLHAPYALRTVVELVTDNGLRGVAEVPGSSAFARAIEQAREVVIGADPLNWHALKGKVAAHCGTKSARIDDATPWNHGAYVQVLSALNVACLDLMGRAFNVTVAALLGGVLRERVPYSAYLFYKHEGAGGELGFGTDPRATGWAAARQAAALDPDGIVNQARAVVREFGFKSIKLKGGVFEPAQEIAAMKALREAFGPGVPLRIDPNARWSVETSIKAGRELEGVLEYLEDPTSGQEGMAAVRRALTTPLATNMCTTSFEDLPGSVRLGSEDIILTDHHFWGGLNAAMELAAHCRTFGRGVSMHSNNHGGISLAAMTHLGAAMPNLSFALDTHYPWQWEDVIVGGRLRIEDGCVALPKGPGLGVELDRAALARAHENFRRCGLKDRDDAFEMRKKIPGWKFQSMCW